MGNAVIFFTCIICGSDTDKLPKQTIRKTIFNVNLHQCNTESETETVEKVVLKYVYG